MEEEIRAFCGNIADAARDQRYLLAEKGTRRASGGVDESIGLLEERSAKYRDWLKKREDFMRSPNTACRYLQEHALLMPPPAARNRSGRSLCGDHHETEPAACECHSQRDGFDEGGRADRNYCKRGSARPARGSVMIRAVAIAVLLLSPGRMQLASSQGGWPGPLNEPGGSGLAYGETPQMAAYPKQPPPRARGFSLWDDRKSKLFQDARAMSVGDILTVDLAINDKASFDNATDRSRQNASGIEAGINIPVIGSWCR
jgi:hypothetical protein